MEEFETIWAQEFYLASLGEAIQDSHSLPGGQSLMVVDAQEYYDAPGNWEQGVRVPTGLDDSICAYLSLPRENREKFDRAAFWLDAAFRQHNMSVSASFAFLAMAIESLVGRVDNPTAKFCEFIDRYAPTTSRRSRENFYDLRSTIVHGSDLMEIDKGAYFGWTPPEETEMDLTRESWRLTRIAMRGWLAGAGST